ncbi:MAG: hypothetical protein IPJ76_14715 [Flavobacteriales bacterium]|nr:MAG: hypothetical protein IPJ76_14715 [Flavobacteriales bacterium]
MLWADGEPDQAFDIETGLTGGLTYHFGWRAGAGYQLRNFDFALHNNMVIPKGGVKGVPMQHFIMLRAAYLINLD